MAGTIGVPTDKARAHLEYLIANNTSRKRISRDSGVARQTVIGILQGKTQRISKQSEEQLLRVTAAAMTIPAGMLDALGSRRRVRALIAAGHSVPVIAARARLSMAEIAAIASGRQGVVTPSTDTKIRKTFDVMQLEIGRSAAARQLGAERRWTLPLEWDDENIDDPFHKPCRSSNGRKGEIAKALDNARNARPRRRQLVAAA
ncbi:MULTISPECIES: hypothetical protein [Nocardia]|uniref:hypothetical protein n=1 Tax=Nocardia TaxID=1817 RepID=UPI000D6881EE|nr:MULTISPECIES: hypothetical protein [Nocardia]